MREQGAGGAGEARGTERITMPNPQCPMPHAPCPMLHAQSPITIDYPINALNYELGES
jgi:hypothetical protein